MPEDTTCQDGFFLHSAILPNWALTFSENNATISERFTESPFCFLKGELEKKAPP
jgi:hypothetical protein